MSIKILLITEDEVTSFLIRENFEKIGWDLVSSDMLSMGKALNCRPDIIILDIEETGVNGIFALEKLKKREVTDNIPVIALSKLSGEVEDKALSMGVEVFLNKPVDFETLRSKVRFMTRENFVLVVSDNPNVSEIFKIRLESAGRRVEYAYDSDSAIKKIGVRKPEVILIDIFPGSKIAVELLAELEKREKIQDIPVIAFPGRILPEQTVCGNWIISEESDGFNFLKDIETIIGSVERRKNKILAV